MLGNILSGMGLGVLGGQGPDPATPGSQKAKIAQAVGEANLSPMLKIGLQLALMYVSEDALDPVIIERILQGVNALQSGAYDRAAEIFHTFVDEMISGLKANAVTTDPGK